MTTPTIPMDVNAISTEEITPETTHPSEKKIRTPAPSPLTVLNSYQMHSWRPLTHLTMDENYMDMVLLITRNSKCLQGCMGCVLVDPEKPLPPHDASSTDEWERGVYDRIIGVSTNLPLFHENDSDIHAEIGALGQAARIGNSTEGCTAYITMPPCKRCFASLVASGVKRIVSRQLFCDTISEASDRREVELVNTGRFFKEQNERMEALIRESCVADEGGGRDGTSNEAKRIAEFRKFRREEKRARKLKAQDKYK